MSIMIRKHRFTERIHRLPSFFSVCGEMFLLKMIKLFAWGKCIEPMKISTALYKVKLPPKFTN